MTKNSQSQIKRYQACRGDETEIFGNKDPWRLNKFISGKKDRLPRGRALLLFPVYIVVFSAFLDTHAQMPVLSPYAVSLGAGPFWVGLVVGIYSFFNIIGNIIAGVAIDRRGWQKPLFFGLIGASLALLLYTLVPHAAALTAVRAAHGLAGGFLVPAALSCLSTLRRVGDGKEAAVHSRMAFFGIAVGLAALSGPPLSGLAAARWGYASVYLFLAALMLLVAFLTLSLRGAREKAVTGGTAGFNSYTGIIKSPPLLAASIFALGVMGATGTLASFLPPRAEQLGLSPSQTGMLFAAFALSAIIVQGLWPVLIKKMASPVTGAVAGLPLLGLALGLIPLGGGFLSLIPILSLYGSGFGLAFQGMLGLVTTIPDPSIRGKAAGLFFAFYSLGAAIVPPMGGFLFESIPFLSPFYTGALIVLLTLLLGFFTVKGKRGF